MADDDRGGATTRLTGMADCRHGRMLFLRTDHFIGASLAAYGEYGEGEVRIFAQLVGAGQTVVEVGANIGAHTVALARMVGARGAVHAFEPQGVIFQILCANVALNEAFQVRTIRAACGRAEGVGPVPRVNYARAGSNFGGVALVEDGEEVPVHALDSFDFPALRLLKIDVEGMELAVLEGARRQIATHRPVVYVENDRREQSPALIALLQASGYELWWHVPRLFDPDNFAGRPDNIFGTVAPINVLAVPAEEAARVSDLVRIDGPDSWWKDHGL